MKSNIGNVDRIIRILLGLGLILAALMGVIGAWGWIGVVPLVTGFFRVCPAYLLLGFNTCASKT
jgi:Inner membrane protein YgaP-like, transmembrane domain